MAYFSGTASNPAALKTIVETECTANGWILSGGWLSKGTSNVSITAPDVNNLFITGANSSDGLTEPAGFTRAMYVETPLWPVNYYLVVLANPDMVILVINYSATYCQMMMFGNIVKLSDSAYAGGNFFWASADDRAGVGIGFASTICIRESALLGITDTSMTTGSDYLYNHQNTCIPFTTSSPDAGWGEGICAKIDGSIWPTTNKVTYTDTTLSSLYRSPNTWNSQTHLVPMNLQFSMADNLYGYLGYLEHIRLCRIDNYEVGDNIVITPDTWKTFPWIRKNMMARNGGGVVGTTGSIGFAIRWGV